MNLGEIFQGLDKKNGRKEWIPVMVSSQGKNGEYSTE